MHARELYQELKVLTIDQVFTSMIAVYFKKSIEYGTTEELCIRDETGYSLRSLDHSTLTASFSDSFH